MKELEPRLVADLGCLVGEGPIWHPREHVLYFCDIPRGRLYRYDPASEACDCVHEGRPVAAITCQVDGSLLLFRDGGRVDVFRDGRIVDTLIERIDAEAGSRFNDVVADPHGRVFAGTMPTADRPGRLYRIDNDLSVQRIYDNVQLPNGMGFREDMRIMYQCESLTRTVWAFNYEERTGRLSGAYAFLEIDPPARPDGLIVDAEDHVWIGLWGGYAVARYSPEGDLVEQIDLPVPNVTSMALGGPDLDRLFVTTAVGEGELASDVPHSGGLFETRAAHAVGRLEFPSRLGIG